MQVLHMSSGDTALLLATCPMSALFRVSERVCVVWHVVCRKRRVV